MEQNEITLTAAQAFALALGQSFENSTYSIVEPQLPKLELFSKKFKRKAIIDIISDNEILLQILEYNKKTKDNYLLLEEKLFINENSQLFTNYLKLFDEDNKLYADLSFKYKDKVSEPCEVNLICPDKTSDNSEFNVNFEGEFAKTFYKCSIPKKDAFILINSLIEEGNTNLFDVKDQLESFPDNVVVTSVIEYNPDNFTLDFSKEIEGIDTPLESISINRNTFTYLIENANVKDFDTHYKNDVVIFYTMFTQVYQVVGTYIEQVFDIGQSIKYKKKFKEKSVNEYIAKTFEFFEFNNENLLAAIILIDEQMNK